MTWGHVWAYGVGGEGNLEAGFVVACYQNEAK